MLKSKKLKRVFSIIMTSVFCMIAFAQTLYAEEFDYALKGTIDSALEIMEGSTKWTTETSGQIDIDLQSDTGDGAIFTAYKLLDIENVNGMLKVTIPDGAKPFWNSYTGKTSGVDATVGDIKSKINGITGDAAKSSSIVDAFVPFATKPAEIPSTSVTAGKAQITTDFGFYAILQTGAPVNGYIASAPVLACLPMQDQDPDNNTTWLSEFTIVPKDDTISVTKKVHASDESDFKDETITNIGDTVTYEIIAELPEYGADIVNNGITYTLTDELPGGVTIDDGTLNVQIWKEGGASVDKPSFATASYDPGNRTITLTVTDYANNINTQYDKIKITYEAVLNEDAVIEAEGNDNGNINTATLTYSSHGGETATTTADAKVYTMGLDIKKIGEGSGAAALAGAEFKVYKQADGTGDPIKFVETTVLNGIQSYRVATQDEITAGTGITEIIKVTDIDGENKGKLKLDGLDNTKYYFKETKAPSGYNLPKNLVEVDVQPTAYTEENHGDYNGTGTELAFDSNRLLKEITNTTGIDLPVTGGIGTVLFTIVGLLLMAGATYFLFFSRKRSTK